jgi:multifunctional methyltransferase subunit TRM112
MEVRETPLNEDFIRHILPTLNWPAILLAAEAVGLSGLSQELVPELAGDVGFLQAIHRLLLDVHIIEGSMICPESGRAFSINDGVPNMILPESDV